MTEQLLDLPNVFHQAKPILFKIQEAGYEAYFVGGCVRDILLQREIHDVDIATSAFPMEIKQLFSRTIDVGIEHGTVLVLSEHTEYEITTFRTESTYQDFRRPDEVTFVRSLSEDLKRRDFTMNALACDIDGKIIDLFEGTQDIKNRLIRSVGLASERFYEDALRMMRALRFASQLDFDIEPDTFAAIKEHHALLQNISIERIRIEWMKLLLGKNRNRGIRSFIETKCYEYCPRFKNKEMGLRQLLKLPFKQINDEALAWILVCYSFELSVQEVSGLLKEWKCSNQQIKLVKVSYELLLNYITEKKWTVDNLYQANPEIIRLVEEALYYCQKPSQIEKTLRQYEELPIKSLNDLALNGGDIVKFLDKKPGPWLGKLLKEMEYAVLHQKISNTQSNLFDFILLSQKEG